MRGLTQTTPQFSAREDFSLVDMMKKFWKLRMLSFAKAPNIIKDIELAVPLDKENGETNFKRQSFQGMRYQKWNRYTGEPEAEKMMMKQGDPYAFLTGRFNNLVVLDLDTNKQTWKTKGNEHPFILWAKDNIEGVVICEDWKDTVKSILDAIDTFTVISGSGGYHLYFYSENADDYLSSANPNFEIDIRGKGGLIIGFNSILMGKTYGVRQENMRGDYLSKQRLVDLDNNPKIQQMLEFCADKSSKNKKKVKQQKESLKSAIDIVFKYHFEEGEVEDIVKALPKEYFKGSFFKWFEFTGFCKIVGRKDIWKQYHDNKSTDAQKETYWESSRPDRCQVENVLKASNKANNLVYHRYKPVLPLTRTPDSTTDFKKLEFNKGKFDYIDDEDVNFIIQSDTGTGKTTMTKHYLMPTDEDKRAKKFISIVSRRSLGEEQHRDFVVHAENANLLMDMPTIRYYEEKYFKDDPDECEGDNVVICVDSLTKLKNWDYSEYVVFVDELNSVIGHLLSSATLKTKRRTVFAVLKNILVNCKQIIGVDADITDLCFKLFENIGVDFHYRRNLMKHNAGIPAKEYFDFNEFVMDIKELDKYMVCCDSAIECEKLFVDMGEPPDVTVITSSWNPDTQGDIKLDCHPKVIFSPKVIYGLDSTIGRQVFCLFKSQTISPRAMVQQVCRERNIEQLNYIFINKQFLPVQNMPMFSTLEDVKVRLQLQHEYVAKKFGMDIDAVGVSAENENIYDKLLQHYLFDEDSFDTNKFLHFKLMLQEKGFVITTQMNSTKQRNRTEDKQLREEVEQQKLEAFNINDQKHKELNELLRIPAEEIDDYKEVFVMAHLQEQHFNVCDLFFKDDKEQVRIVKETFKEKEFGSRVVEQSKMQILFVKELMKATQAEKKSLVPKVSLTEEQSQQFVSNYKLIFPRNERNFKQNDLEDKRNSLTDDYEVSKLLYACIKCLGCDELYTTEGGRRQINGKRKSRVAYALSGEAIDYHKKLWNYRQAKNYHSVFNDDTNEYEIVFQVDDDE